MNRIAIFALGVMVALAGSASAQIFGVPYFLRVGTLTADVSATVVGSPVRTIATSGRTASGQVNGATGALTNGLNVTSTTRNSTGNYTLNLTAAGFTAAPHCTAIDGSTASPFNVIVTNPAANSATSTIFLTRNSAGAATDTTFQFICNGN